MRTAKKAVKKISKKVAKKLVINHNKQVARDNKVFMALKPAEKRVAIARDVLAQIRLKRLIPTTGVWLAGKDESPLFTKADIKRNPELQSLLATKKECTGCALGGMFMCAVEVADKLKLNELEKVKEYQRDLSEESPAYKKYVELESGTVATDDAFKYLRNFFSQEQLDDIECAFEQGGGHSTYSDAADFAPEEENPSERMRLIMENIIVNKGNFVYTKQPEQRYVTPGFVG